MARSVFCCRCLEEIKQIISQLPDETCQSLTHGENLSIRKGVAVSPPISISLPFSAPPQDHEGYSLPKKNNLSSAKIFTAIMRKSLAFIWGLGFCYYYWFNASQFSDKNKTRKRLRQSASRPVFDLICFSLLSLNGNTTDFSSNCCDGVGS